jgi:hypothetical protein
MAVYSEIMKQIDNPGACKFSCNRRILAGLPIRNIGIGAGAPQLSHAFPGFYPLTISSAPIISMTIRNRFVVTIVAFGMASSAVAAFTSFGRATETLRRHQSLQAVVFSADPIQSRSRFYRCVFTTGEFHKTLGMRATDSPGFVAATNEPSVDPEETAMATPIVPAPSPSAQAAARGPPPARTAAIPILAQALPKIQSITIDTRTTSNLIGPTASSAQNLPPGKRGSRSPTVSKQSKTDLPEDRSDEQSSRGVRATLSNDKQPTQKRPVASHPVSPVASDPVAKAKLVGETKLRRPVRAPVEPQFTPTTSQDAAAFDPKPAKIVPSVK